MVVEAVAEQLQEGGYERRPIVEERGEFSVRGGIIDLFPPLYAQPVRLEFFGDEVESLRFFDPANQRSKGSLDEMIALPVSEVILDEPARDQALQGKSRRRDPNFWRCVSVGLRFPGIERHLADFYPETYTLWDYLPPDMVVVEWEPWRAAQELEKLTGEASTEPAGWLDQESWEVRRRAFTTVRCESLTWGEPETGRSFAFQVGKNDGLAQELAQAAGEDGRVIPALAQCLTEWRRQELHVLLISLNAHRAARLAQMLAAEGLDAEVLYDPDFPLLPHRSVPNDVN